MRKKLFYNDLISLFVESYSLVSVCCLINLGFIRFDSFGHGFHSVMCIFFTLMSILWPIQLFWLSVKNFDDLKTDYYQERYGSLYEDINLRKPRVLLQPMFFFIRRLLLAVAVVIFDRVLIW